MTATTNGVLWDDVEVRSVTDGDTFRCWRHRDTDPVRVDEGLTMRTCLSDDRELLPEGVAIRLAWVNTPERGNPSWASARADLRQFLTEHADVLQLVTYGGGGFDRILGDVGYVDGGVWVSCSQWLMRECGWPPYTGSAA